MLNMMLLLSVGTIPAYNGWCVQVGQRWCLCCSRSVPQPIDSHWSNNPVRMRLPPGGVPASYPQMKLPVLDNPALFEKLDTEALFFAFYYMPGTHQQYLAARELKRQSWRYHKQHGAWFQVHLASAFSVMMSDAAGAALLLLAYLHNQNLQCCSVLMKIMMLVHGKAAASTWIYLAAAAVLTCLSSALHARFCDLFGASVCSGQWPGGTGHLW